MVGIAHEAVEGGLVVAGGALLFVLLELLDDALHVGGEGLLAVVLAVRVLLLLKECIYFPCLFLKRVYFSVFLHSLYCVFPVRLCGRLSNLQRPLDHSEELVKPLKCEGLHLLLIFLHPTCHLCSKKYNGMVVCDIRTLS